jgi:hypothetical protein
MLAGSLSYLEGARIVSDSGSPAGLQDDELDPFRGVVSETDALPIGAEIRKLWSAAALEKLQPAIDKAELWAHEILEPYCRSLVARL